MKRDSLTTLESMSAIELLEVIRYQYAIQDARRDGFTHWEAALRSDLRRLLGTKRHAAILSVVVYRK